MPHLTDIQARGKICEILAVLSEHLGYDLLCEHFTSEQQETIIKEMMKILQREGAI